MKEFISPIEFIEEIGGARVFMKRDDLIPFSYGGNKVLIADSLVADALSKGADLIVSYGAAYSNLNRAVADTALARGLRCHVIIKDDNAFARSIPLNERLVREAGADITYCTRDKVHETVEKVLSEATQDGFKPYYVYGDSYGQGNVRTLTKAYEKEFGELRDFDHVFIAVGTGASICGLIAGRAKTGAATPTIHGISIAKDAESAICTIRSKLADTGAEEDFAKGIVISDEYIEAQDEMKDEIRRMYREHGIPLDPIYTGKAWYGMKEEIKREDLTGDIVFIHTGGYPCFVDAAPALDIELENRG